MKTVHINTGSWHFRLLERLSYDSHYSTDVCTYTSGVVGAILLSIVLVALAALLTVSLGDELAWIAACLISLSWIVPEQIAVPALFCTGFILFSCVLVLLELGFEKLPEEKKRAIHDTYQTVTGKLCARIELAD